jgi:hypothetical protein
MFPLLPSPTSLFLPRPLRKGQWPRRALAVGAAALLSVGAAHAELSDEIQVYADDINKPREFGLELHVNTTPSGRRVPDYPGEAVPNKGWRITPEFSYGLSDTLEGGLYIPTNRDADGHYAVAGAKVRLKWLPVRSEDNGKGGEGAFFGANVELSRLQQKFSLSRSTAELRLMSGYRAANWLVAINPVFGWNLSDGQRDKTPDLGVSLKAARQVAESLALGVEYYTDLGTTSRLLPSSQQAKTLYLAADLDTRPVNLNIGVGRGLNGATDRWTVKAIFGFEFR